MQFSPTQWPAPSCSQKREDSRKSRGKCVSSAGWSTPAMTVPPPSPSELLHNLLGRLPLQPKAEASGGPASPPHHPHLPLLSQAASQAPSPLTSAGPGPLLPSLKKYLKLFLWDAFSNLGRVHKNLWNSWARAAPHSQVHTSNCLDCLSCRVRITLQVYAWFSYQTKTRS